MLNGLITKIYISMKREPEWFSGLLLNSKRRYWGSTPSGANLSKNASDSGDSSVSIFIYKVDEFSKFLKIFTSFYSIEARELMSHLRGDRKGVGWGGDSEGKVIRPLVRSMIQILLLLKIGEKNFAWCNFNQSIWQSQAFAKSSWIER